MGYDPSQLTVKEIMAGKSFTLHFGETVTAQVKKQRNLL